MPRLYPARVFQDYKAKPSDRLTVPAKCGRACLSGFCGQGPPTPTRRKRQTVPAQTRNAAARSDGPHRRACGVPNAQVPTCVRGTWAGSRRGGDLNRPKLNFKKVMATTVHQPITTGERRKAACRLARDLLNLTKSLSEVPPVSTHAKLVEADQCLPPIRSSSSVVQQLAPDAGNVEHIVDIGFPMFRRPVDGL